MKIKFDKAYEFKHVEKSWYERWEKAKAFAAKDKDSRPAFSISMPPPNVTGYLHVGHALNHTLQDILIRFKRMDGFNTLWLPGTDHAGIATQNVVERMLAEEGKARQDLGRDAFLERVWQWKEKSGNKIIEQLKRLGASCDWDRLRFTMDEGLSNAVRHVFVELYDQGLIYRDLYIINWSPGAQTAVSDLEVEHKEVDGKLYSMKYPIRGEDDSFIEVATTRPETMLGDVAVAVHPDDERYQDKIGKTVMLPFVNREIPIIADAAVKADFGSGAVKITPGHDFNDFEMGQRHDLEIITILDIHAHIDCPNTPFHGLHVKEARKQIVAELDKLGLYVGDKPHRHMVGHCSRTNTIVEPRVSKQWFVRTKALADEALKAVKDGRTEFVPKNWEKTYFEWLENIRDWCISRQIWWGHRIPVWTCSDCGEVMACKENPTACRKCEKTNLQQETDVLDTWFSSALWPFSTLGWPENTQALKTFYPTSVLSTGFDIIFFWVARMMMMGLHFMKDVPFLRVNIHALIRDGQGQKMSKSKGNVIDPIEIMDQDGCDALRFTLAALAIQGRDIALSKERVVGYRHFINKLWNASRFVAMSIEEVKESLDKQFISDVSAIDETMADTWMLSRLDSVTETVRLALEEMRFSDAALALYQFVWHEYCDWYIEMAKTQLDIKNPERASKTVHVLIHSLDTVLRLLHPITPFVTEDIWQKVMALKGEQPSDFLILASFPKKSAKKYNESVVADMDLLQRMISAVRTLKSENHVAPGKKVSPRIKEADESQRLVLENGWRYFSALVKLEDGVTLDNVFTGGDQATKGPIASTVVDGMTIDLPLGELLDVAKETARLERQIAKVEKEVQQLQKKLSNEGFLKKAPSDVVEEQKQRLESSNSELESLKLFLDRLKG